MNRILAITLGSALLLGTASLTFAQEEKKEPLRQERKENQQKRIAQGVQSGSLTPKETSKLEHKEANLNKQVKDMKANGPLTTKEKLEINQKQNKISKDIYKQKHDAQTQKQ